MFQDSTFWNSFLISLRFSIIYLPITLIVSLFAAVMISRVRNGVAAGTFRVIVYMPVIVPISISMLLWVKLFDPQLGYLNTLLRGVGVQNPPNWLGSPASAPYAMILPTIWAHFGSWALLFLIGIYNINREIYEAALVDGANAWHQFRSVTVPLLKPIFALGLGHPGRDRGGDGALCRHLGWAGRVGPHHRGLHLPRRLHPRRHAHGLRGCHVAVPRPRQHADHARDF
jgi:ABC-type sugar transport system permease subunit